MKRLQKKKKEKSEGIQENSTAFNGKLLTLLKSSMKSKKKRWRDRERETETVHYLLCLTN